MSFLHLLSFFRYYNGPYDLPVDIGLIYPDDMSDADRYNYNSSTAQQLSKVAEAAAKTLYNLSRGADSEAFMNDIEVNETLVGFQSELSLQ